MGALELFHQSADHGADSVRTANVGQFLGFANALDRRLDSDQHKHPRLLCGPGGNSAIVTGWQPQRRSIDPRGLRRARADPALTGVSN